MTEYTIQVVFDTDDDVALGNIRDDVALMIATAVPTVTIVSATLSGDGPLVDLIDLAHDRTAQAQTQATDPQAQAADPQEPSTESIPTGKEF